MLDIKYIRANADEVREGARRKRFDVDIDRILELDDQRREIVGELEKLRHQQNQAGKKIAQLKGADKQSAVAEMGQISSRVKELEGTLSTVESERDELLSRVPQPAAPEVPDGVDDTDNVELRTWGEVPSFDFEIKDHITLGQELGLIDFPRASKLSGSRTYILMREGAMLELAVLQLARDILLKKGFVHMVVPTLVKYEPLFGTAYFPGGEDQAYLCDKDNLYLAGTSEVPVTAFHSGETLQEEDLPLFYAGNSTCYRREAGAAGRDTKGLYRIHQFNKVEQEVICKNDAEESLKHHQFILQNSEEILQALELPYRVVNVCTGDLGMGQLQKFDIECWMPSREGWGETHSASRFHEFQSRRMNLRYRDANGKMKFCHTLNNTAIATPRVLIPILENNQQADGSIRIPKVLLPYMGGIETIDPQNRSKVL